MEHKKGMLTNEKNVKKHKRHVFLLIVAVWVIVLFSFALVVVGRNDKREISSLADETLGFIEAICSRYDGYEAGNKAVALKEILDKTKGLTECIDEKILENPDDLSTYVNEMDLSGAILTDEDGKLVMEVDAGTQDLYSEWESFLTNENKLDIVQNPNKTFCTQLSAYGTDYYVALVSRQDTKGLMLGYRDSASAQTDLYETSIDKTLTNNTFHKNPRIVITDTKSVVASNNDFLKLGMDISDEPLSELGSKHWAQGKLVRIVWEKRVWYGKREAYGRYLIYVFYSSNEVYTHIIPASLAFVALCALIALILVLVKSRSEKHHLEKERGQLQTIQAISSLYVATSIIHLKEKIFEGIESTDRAQQVLDETVDAREVPKLLAKRVIAPEDRERYIEFLNIDTLEKRLSDRKNLSTVFRDVNGIWFSTFLVPMQYDQNGKLTDILFASRNINEYKQKEVEYQEKLKKTARDAEIANAAKSSFLRRMSHDIRTPINGIRGMSVVAKRSLNNKERVNECLDKILYSSDYLKELLDDILRLSKLESGKMIFDERAIDLKSLIERTATLTKEQADEKKVNFTLDLSGLTHTRVIVSPVHLRQIMQNVMSNAVKFNKVGGEVNVICREESHPDPDKMLFEFICSDTGIGIDTSFQKNIFEPFAQEMDSARSSYAGAGLGLSIVKEILEQRGGSISFTSEKGEGSTFHITVPLTLDLSIRDNEEGEDKLQKKEQKPISLSGIRILLAEDNEINMEIARELLESAKAIVIPAKDGEEAVKIFSASKQHEFDVILMDIMMPKMDGLEATKVIRSLNRADAATVPIFAMTANAFVEDVQKSREAGMNEHFSKPLDMEQVILMIYRYCRR